VGAAVTTDAEVGPDFNVRVRLNVPPRSFRWHTMVVLGDGEQVCVCVCVRLDLYVCMIEDTLCALSGRVGAWTIMTSPTSCRPGT
jgi:hypothetical protein